MALGTPDPSITFEDGASASRPTFHATLRFLGDDAYPAGGTSSFEAFVATALGKEGADVLYVVDGAHSSTNHHLVYDRENDKLKVILLSTGSEAAPGDLSAITFNAIVVYR